MENNLTNNEPIHPSIIFLFNKHYPELNPIEIDKDLFVDMMTNILALEQAKIDKEEANQKDNEKEDAFESKVIEQNYLMANEIIPEMFVSNDLIYLKGRLNKIDVNILIDSGCQTSTIFKSTTDRANLDYIIDKKACTICQGVGGLTKTYGMLWFTELEIETESESDKFVTVPIKLSVVDNTKKNDLEQELDNIKMEQDELIELVEEKNKLDLLLGIDFMKAYKAIVNFNKKIITLNDSIVINYN
jgi:hypothetical protein